jgi:hypothetical protein
MVNAMIASSSMLTLPIRAALDRESAEQMRRSALPRRHKRPFRRINFGLSAGFAHTLDEGCAPPNAAHLW